MTKHGHACVRFEDGDRVLVIDPGVWTDAVALRDATDVLITHEHADHVDADMLRQAGPGLTVHTHPALAATLNGVTVHEVNAGDEFTAAGFGVRAVGGAHAEIYDGLPGCVNIGFIVDGAVYHPGDSFFVPGQAVSTLLVPASAPWFKLGEALEFVRAIGPARAFAIHESLLNERGLDNFGRWMQMKGQTDYTFLAPGESVTL